MPLCGFTEKMLKGLTLYSQGLYEAAVRRAEESDISVKEAMEVEIQEMNVFLAALDEHYDELKTSRSVDEAMRELVAWSEENAPQRGMGSGSESG